MNGGILMNKDELPAMKVKINRHLWPSIQDKTEPKREQETQMANYASSIEKIVTCMLRSYWDRTDKIDEDFSNMSLTFEHGNHIHTMLVDFIKKSGVWRGDEVRGSNPTYNMSYRIDALIADPTNNGLIVPIEIKSVKASSWSMVKDEPFLSHYLQLQIYMHFHKPEPYPYGYVVYYNKNEDTVKSFLCEHDVEMCGIMESCITELEERIKSGDRPKPAETTEPCYWCQYKSRCFAGEDDNE